VTCLQARAALDVCEIRLIGGRRRSRLRERHAAVERRLFAAGPDALADVAIEPREDPLGGRVELVVWLAERAPPGDGDGDGDGGELVLYLRHNGRLEGAEQAFRRAVLRGDPCVETEALLRGAGELRLIERTISGARPYSVTLSRDKALWKLAATTGRAAERALAAPHAAGDPRAAHVGALRPEPARAPAPSTAELMLRSPWRWLRIVAGRLLFDRSWQVRVREAQPSATAGWSRGAPSPVAWRAGHVYADPLLFEHEGRHHLFCEEIPAGSRRGMISHVELRPGGRARPPEPVLTERHHLSYPFVFAHGGEIFMIPETSSERSVTLYRATEFPGGWQREAVLLDGLIASDATLLSDSGRLWLFVGVAAEHATMLDELHLYSALTLTGDWQAHPLNPVVSDVRCARPAGAVQRWGSALVRPAQDCGRRYGGAVSFRQIDALSTELYAEHEIARLEPGDLGGRARATHTYASDGTYEATDLRERSLRSLGEAVRLTRRAGARAGHPR
jgi:hypothetical protein